MLSIKRLLLACSVIISLFATAQQPTIKILESGKKISIRGLSVVSDKIIWASGSGGNVALSTDGGNTFTWMKVPGYEKMDFRDIEAFDKNTAVIMGITAPAVILKTKDGGKNWAKVFEDTAKGAFLDAIDFGYRENGLAIGDPIDSSFYMLSTSDHGDTWRRLTETEKFIGRLSEGEAFFASSGTNFRMLGNHPMIVSGGKSSRLYTGMDRSIDWTALPIMQGKESTGANSIAVYEKDSYNGKLKAVVVGGDFSKDTISSNNCVLIELRPKLKFTQPQTPPHGYRSCVIYLDKKKLLTCGTSGIDISKDGGMNWELISKESFHVCQKAKKGKAVFLAGGGGRIAKLVYP
jgi:hypothetical protein